MGGDTNAEPNWRHELYASYVRTHAGFSGTQERVYAAEVAPYLPADRKSRVVDLGCGQGGLIMELQRAGYENVYGIDVSPQQVNIARNRGLDLVVEGDFRAWLPVQDPFDVIVAIDVLEHIPRDQFLDTLKLLQDSLEPSGRLIARVPNAVSPFSGYYHFGDYTHEWPLTARSLRQLALAADFRECVSFECRPHVHGVKSFLRLLIWKVAAGVLKTVLAAETGVTRGHLVTQNLVVVMTRDAAKES